HLPYPSPILRLHASDFRLQASALSRESSLLPRMILPLDVPFQLRAVEVHIPQIARAISRGLIVEVWRLGIAALPAGRDGPGLHAIAELDYGHEAVAAGAVHLFGPFVGARAE